MHIKVPDKIKERIKKGLSKYSKILETAIQRDLNESDTSNIVNDMLGDVFGYDKFFDVTSEYRIRGQYADYGIKLNDVVKMLIEVKAIGVKLNEQHIFQAVSYAANEGIEWVVLTNAHNWQLYHVSFVKPIEKELVFSVSLLDESIKMSDKTTFLYLISKESLLEGVLEQYWKEITALSAENIVSVLFSDDILDKIRRGLKQLTGYTITPAELRAKLKAAVIKEDLSAKPIRPFQFERPPRKKPAVKKEEAA